MKLSYEAVFIKCANAGLSITELIKKAGIGRNTWLCIKAGKNVTPLTVSKLAKALDTTAEAIILKGGE